MRAWPRTPWGRQSSTRISTGEADRLLVGRPHQYRRPLLHQAEQDAAGQRPVGVADPAEHHGGEHRQQQQPAGARGQAGGDGGEHAGQPGQAAGKQPGVGHHAAGVDAAHLGQVEAVGQRPHRLAHQRGLQHQPDQREHDAGGDHHGHLDRADRQAEGVPGLVAVDVEQPVLPGPAELDQVADHERQPDRDQQQLQDAGAAPAHRAPQGGLQRKAHRRDRRQGRQDRHGQGHPGADVDREGHVAAERHEVAVGEVDELQDPVDQRQPDRAERVDGAARQAVDRGLGELLHMTSLAGSRKANAPRRRARPYARRMRGASRRWCTSATRPPVSATAARVAWKPRLSASACSVATP